MAKGDRSSPPPAPAEAPPTTPEPAAEPPAPAAAFPAPAQAADPPPKKKKKGTSNAELRLMRHLELRFADLPSDKARRRVFDWMADNYGPQDGGS